MMTSAPRYVREMINAETEKFGTGSCCILMFHDIAKWQTSGDKSRRAAEFEIKGNHVIVEDIGYQLLLATCGQSKGMLVFYLTNDDHRRFAAAITGSATELDSDPVREFFEEVYKRRSRSFARQLVAGTAGVTVETIEGGMRYTVRWNPRNHPYVNR